MMLKNFLNRNKWKLLTVAVIVFGLIVRMKDFNVLPIDAHPMRQTDTECVAYFIANGKADFLHPKSCLMRPVSNTNGYFFLEMPFYELLIAGSYKIFGFYPYAARLVNLVLYLFGSLALFGFMSKWINKMTALFGLIAFSFIPGSIFFVGHAIHPDALAVSFIFVSLYFAWKYKDKGRLFSLIMSGLTLGVSVASRPFGLICLPMIWYFLYLKKSKSWDYLLITLLGVGFYGWWWWRTKHLGIDMSWENWVLSGREKLLEFENIKKLVWRNMIGETMGKTVSILAGVGLIGVIIKRNKIVLPLILWALGVVIYWFIVPNGNLTHQYYANVYIPLFVILAGLGLNFVFLKNKWLAVLLIPVLIYNGVRTSSYHYDNRGKAAEVKIAKEIVDNIPEDKKIIYLATDDSVTLSLSHRQGWKLGEWPTDVAVHIWSFMEMRNYKFDYIVEPKNRMDINTDEFNIIKLNYPLVKELEYTRIYQYK